MEFELIVLGSGSATPSQGRNQTAQVVRIGNSYLLIDCGEGTWIQLKKHKVKSSKIDAIFVSHLHGDHYLGLMGLISGFHLNNRKKPLLLFGPKGLDELITLHLRLGDTKLSYRIDFHETSTDGRHLLLDEKNFKVFSFPLKHRIPCTGFIVQEKEGPRNLIKEKLLEYKPDLNAINALKSGEDYLDDLGNVLYRVEDFTYPPDALRKYAFCSDTVYDERIVEHLQNIDLLYHEATFMETDRKRAVDTMHSTAKQAASIAKAAKAKMLILGHFSARYPDLQPLLEEALEIFPNTILSEEGASYFID